MMKSPINLAHPLGVEPNGCATDSHASVAVQAHPTTSADEQKRGRIKNRPQTVPKSRGGSVAIDISYKELQFLIVQRRQSSLRMDCSMSGHRGPTVSRARRVLRACVFCPYHSDREWQRLKDEEPAEFQRAVAVEKAYQAAKATTISATGFRPFLHRSRKPLDEVDFNGSKADWIQEQLHGMGQECEGICGV